MIPPSQYKERYENISVPVDDNRSVTVSVNKYVLRSIPSFYNAAAADTFVRTLSRRGIDTDLRVDTQTGTTRVDPRLTQHADAVKKGKPDLVLSGGGLTRNDVRVDTRVTDWFALARYAFAGKGSPEACQIVLQLALHWGLTTNPQEYADSALGLDCNGFVGNYIWHVLRNNSWTTLGYGNQDLGPDSPIRNGFYDRYKHQLLDRWENLDNKRAYIMMRTDDAGEVINQKSGDLYAHIVITEPGGRLDRPQGASNPFAVTVVESTASSVPPGLSKSYYSCTHVSAGKVFSINREAMIPSHRDMKFKIAPVT